MLQCEFACVVWKISGAKHYIPDGFEYAKLRTALRPLTSSRLIDDSQYAAQAEFDYNFDQTGPLTDFGFVSFEKLSKQYRGSFSSVTESVLNQFPADWPEMEYIGGDAYTGYNTNFMTADPRESIFRCYPPTPTAFWFIPHVLRVFVFLWHVSRLKSLPREECWPRGLEDDGYEYASIDSALVAPLSRGNVTINSTDTMVRTRLSDFLLTRRVPHSGIRNVRNRKRKLRPPLCAIPRKSNTDIQNPLGPTSHQSKLAHRWSRCWGCHRWLQAYKAILGKYAQHHNRRGVSTRWEFHSNPDSDDPTPP